MGLIYYGAPASYVLSLQKRLSIDCFVETGTFEGGTAGWAAKHFKQVVTIELSERQYHRASTRLARLANVTQLLGNSPDLLSELAPSLPRAIVWLDAHWSGGNEAGRERQCPLLDEITALAPCWGRALVLVDDAHLFLSPPSAGYDLAQWPSLTQVVGALSAGADRFVACFEDVLVSLPAEGRDVTLEYIRADGGQGRRVPGIPDGSGQGSIPAKTEKPPGPTPSVRRAGTGRLRLAARRVRQLLRRPAMALARTVGHLPVDLGVQRQFVWFVRTFFEHPRVPFEIDFCGYRYPGSGNDVIDLAVYYFGAFEWPVVALLHDLARGLASGARKPVFYDIGANTGQHSLFVARDVQHIYAFEPFAPVRKIFEQRIRINDLSHVDLLPFGLGDREGEAHYYLPLTINRGTGSFLAGITPENSRRAILLPMKIGDQLIEERGLTPPDLVKLDVEGSEKLVLGGLERTFKQYRPVIVSELSDASRWLFGGEAGLRSKLYDDCLLFDVTRRAVPRGYRLQPFEYARSAQFLCLPRERSSLLARLRGRLDDGAVLKTSL
jgi:FkbM family methyltransferase